MKKPLPNSIHQSKSSVVGFFVLLLLFLAVILLPTAPAQTASPETTGKGPAAQNLIYSDGVQSGWSFDDIGFVDTNEFASAPVFAGIHSFEVIYQTTFSRFHFVADSVFSVSDYDSISFHIFGSDASQTLSFELLDEGFNSLGVVSIPLVANTWTPVTIQTSEFAPSNQVKYVQFNNPSTLSPIYLDNVFLGDPDPVTPTPTTPPPTATPAPNTPKVIYEDAVAVDWTLQNVGSATSNPNSTTHVFAGTQALELEFADTSAVIFFQTANPFDPKQYSSINFALKGNDVGQTFSLELAAERFVSLNTVSIEITDTSWNQIALDMDQFRDTGDVEYILIRDVSSSSPIYIDNLNLNFTEAPPLFSNTIFLPVALKE